MEQDNPNTRGLGTTSASERPGNTEGSPPVRSMIVAGRSRVETYWGTRRCTGTLPGRAMSSGTVSEA